MPMIRPLEVDFSIDNPWFSGRASVCTFSREKILATKLRALLQRNKRRDLYELAHALKVFEGQLVKVPSLVALEQRPQLRRQDLLPRKRAYGRPSRKPRIVDAEVYLQRADHGHRSPAC